jgi:hypothetical protein
MVGSHIVRRQTAGKKEKEEKKKKKIIKSVVVCWWNRDSFLLLLPFFGLDGMGRRGGMGIGIGSPSSLPFISACMRIGRE